MTDILVALVGEECCKCGIMFGISQEFQKRRRRDHGTFYCPMGHGQHYPGESDVERAKRVAEEARRRAAAAEGRAERERQVAKRERKRAAGYKGQVTKIKRRISRGVCPCCSRTFQNLARHMAGQHPDWEPDEEVIEGMRVSHRGGPWYDVVREDGELVTGPVRGRAKAFRELLAVAGGDDDGS